MKIQMKTLNMLSFIWALALSLLTVSAHAGVDIQTWQTSKGAKVLFVETKQLPILDIEITFDAGSARDGKDWGLASITSGLVGTSTKDLNEEQIAQAFDEIGAQVGSSVSRDNASQSLRTLTRPEIMQKALDMFATTISQTEFDADVFDREMKRLKIGLKQQSVKPQVISNELLWKTLYGDHPYGHPSSGTLESVEKINLKKVKDFYKRFYVTSNATIAMVGNVSRAKAEEIAEQITQNFPQGKPAAVIAEPVRKTADDSLIEFESTQTYYSLATIGVERGNPDYIPLFVGNHLLGGSGFGSMLMEEVREKRGLVYSVYSYFAPMKVAGPFIIGLSTKNASAYEADEVVKQTLNDFLKEIPDEKLQAIKDNLTGGFPLRIDSNGKILGYLSMIGFYGLPLDYLDQFPKEVEKVTKEQILAAWKKHVKPQELVRLMVGSPNVKS